MKATEALKEIMKEQGVSSGILAKRLQKNPCLICERLSQENISVNKLSEMLAVLDYKIILVPSDNRLPSKGYEIGNTEK